MPKRFNCSGPCVPEDHYMINTEERFTNVEELIDQKSYFILHAPRQTGKSTNMIQLAEKLNKEDKYIALFINIEAGQAIRNQVDRVNNLILSEIEGMAKIYLPPEYHPSEACFNVRSMEQGLQQFLRNWCLELPKPLVLFVDEIDSLIGDSLISVLRQLRGGYSQRPKAYPHSLCLIGLRDVRDYRIFSDETQRYVVGGSAFNIEEKSVRIQDFTLDQVQRLYQQHTDETGQAFLPEALELIYTQTNGQPWLVNALGRELCFEEHKVPDGRTVTCEDVEKAVEVLILRRDVHLDQLGDKLTEERVSEIIGPILIGEHVQLKDEKERELLNDRKTISEQQQYLIDLGLIRFGKKGSTKGSHQPDITPETPVENRRMAMVPR